MFDFHKRFFTSRTSINSHRLIVIPILYCALVGTVYSGDISLEAVLVPAPAAAPASASEHTAESASDPTLASALDEQVDETAKTLFDSSGLRELVQQIPISTASSFESALSADQLPELFEQVEQAAIRRAVNNAFRSETFDKYLVKELQNGMTLPAREYMLEWYASALGARARQAELDNSLLTQQSRFSDYQLFLSRYPVSVKRAQLILNLDYTMQSTESAVDMMTNIQVAFNLSLSPFMPEQMRLSRQEIQAMAQQNQEQLLVQYEKQTHDVLLFTYQDLSDDELGKLDEVLATDAGQAFVEAINNGIKKAMFAASLDLGDGLGALLKHKQLDPGI